MTIGENLRRTAELFPDRAALIVCSQGYRATYRELWDATTEIALALLADGVERGDRVGLWSPNRFEWVVLQYASARVGAILVNLNPAYKTAEIEYALVQSGTRVLFLARAFRQNDYVGMLAQVRERCPDLRAAFVLDDDWPALRAAARRAPVSPVHALAEREAGAPVRRPDQHPIHLGHNRFSQGGDAFAPQRAQQTASSSAKTMRLTHDEDRVCIPVPFYHCFFAWSSAGSGSLLRYDARRLHRRPQRGV